MAPTPAMSSRCVMCLSRPKMSLTAGRPACKQGVCAEMCLSSFPPHVVGGRGDVVVVRALVALGAGAARKVEAEVGGVRGVARGLGEARVSVQHAPAAGGGGARGVQRAQRAPRRDATPALTAWGRGPCRGACSTSRQCTCCTKCCTRSTPLRAAASWGPQRLACERDASAIPHFARRAPSAH